MILNENINRIKQVMGLLNEQTVENIKRPPGDPYVYATKSNEYNNVRYLTYKCGKNKQCPNPIPWIDVSEGRRHKKPGYAKFEAAIKYLIYQKQPTEYKIINNIPLTSQELNVSGELDLNRSEITSLPEGLKVGGDLNLHMCKNITSLPEGLKVGGWLDLYGCENIKSLPKGLEVEGKLYIRRNSDLHKYSDDEIREMIKPGFVKGDIEDF
jgi:hypothetical protein